MSKWKCEICEKEFENFHAQGFDNKIYCPLCFFKEKTNRLEKENARLKEERKQIKEYVEKCNFDNAEILFDFGSEYCYIDDFKEHILEILKEN